MLILLVKLRHDFVILLVFDETKIEKITSNCFEMFGLCNCRTFKLIGIFMFILFR
jgi:hypothetical protein